MAEEAILARPPPRESIHLLFLPSPLSPKPIEQNRTTNQQCQRHQKILHNRGIITIRIKGVNRHRLPNTQQQCHSLANDQREPNAQDYACGRTQKLFFLNYFFLFQHNNGFLSQTTIKFFRSISTFGKQGWHSATTAFEMTVFPYFITHFNTSACLLSTHQIMEAKSYNCK